MTPMRLDGILTQIGHVSVAVLGDFCLDAYWLIDRRRSERSIETGKHTIPVRQQYYNLGGAGNIVANLCAIGVKRIHAIGVVGPDLFGEEMIRKLKSSNADTSGILIQSEGWATPVYGKLYAGEEEEPRVDFGVYNEINAASEDALTSALEKALPQVEAVILNQQLPHGIASDRLLEKLNAIIAAHGNKIFIVDSRKRSEKFHKVSYRFNAHEAARLCGQEIPVDQRVQLDDACRYASEIHALHGQPVFVSRGDRGSLVCDQTGISIVPGIQVLKQTDAVGAGDTSISATAAAMAAGATPLESATLANFASVVTVQKIRTTGTATPQEIREVGADPDYVFRPELASDPRSARYFEDSEIECITGSVPSRGIKHALFDHDGTISTLRQGWEPIMEDMFIRTILGPAYATADETLYRRVADRVREYIIRSTGIQTLKQMLALGDMVRELGYVPASQVLDPHGYKRIYLEALMKTVSARVKKFSRKELNVEDFTIKGSVDFLKALRIRGVRLYLASGTDDADVKAEAHALGYAELFDGGIHGATDDVQHDAKRVVIDRILTTNQLNGSELVCFGDGPVELREGRKRGGMAVGIASDEVRRYGMSPEKRSRLICAGADVIIADFSQPEALLKRLFG